MGSCYHVKQTDCGLCLIVKHERILLLRPLSLSLSLSLSLCLKSGWMRVITHWHECSSPGTYLCVETCISERSWGVIRVRAPVAAGFSLNAAAAAAVMWEVGFTDAVLDLVSAKLIYIVQVCGTTNALYIWCIHILSWFTSGTYWSVLTCTKCELVVYFSS